MQQECKEQNQEREMINFPQHINCKEKINSGKGNTEIEKYLRDKAINSHVYILFWFSWE